MVLVYLILGLDFQEIDNSVEVDKLEHFGFGGRFVQIPWKVRLLSKTSEFDSRWKKAKVEKESRASDAI